MSGPQRRNKKSVNSNDHQSPTNMKKDKKKKTTNKSKEVNGKVVQNGKGDSNSKSNGKIDCINCVDDTLEANQLLWSELREHILYLYKIGREKNLAPTTVDRVKYLVDTLCTKDIHQLFIRLELLATTVVKDWFESVERIFVNEIRSTTIAYNYLENIMTECDNYLLAARKMLPMLRSLESHLKRFKMCWILIHQNLFRMHYVEEPRCIVRIKKCKLLLLFDLDVPIFSETIVKWARFNEAFNTLTEERIECDKKVRAFRELNPIYKNYENYFTDEWQNFPSIKKKNKPNTADTNRKNAENSTKMNGKKQQTFPERSEMNGGAMRLQNGEAPRLLTKTQAKKARRKAAADHSRQPSADLMPPPPPRITEADLSHFRSESASECDSSNDRVQQSRKKTDRASPQTPVKRQHQSQIVTNSKLSSSDSRDVDELVAFVEGLNINDNEIDEVQSENKKRRKKQKKEKQRLKKIQNLIEEEEDQVTQLMKRSPGVTITMVRSDTGPAPPPHNHFENCQHSHQFFNSANSGSMPKPNVAATQSHVRFNPQPKNIPIVQPPPVPQPPPTTSVNGSTLTYNPGSRMVTIRRITEANTDEPTVTITLKGPTPDQDQVLYRIINGQADYGHLADNILTKNGRREDTNQNENIPNEVTPLTKKQKKKLKKQKENQLPLENAIPAPQPPVPVQCDVGQFIYSANNLPNGYSYYDNDFIRITKVPVPETEPQQSIQQLPVSKKSKKQKKKELKANGINPSDSLNDPSRQTVLLENQGGKKIVGDNSLTAKDNLMVKVTNNIASQGKPKSPQPNQGVKPIKTQEYTSKKSKKQQELLNNDKSKTKESRQTKSQEPTKNEKPTKGKQKTKLEPDQNSIPQNKQTKIFKRQQKNYNPEEVIHPVQNNATGYQQNSGQFLVENNFKLIPENLRLPAGITITKVTASMAPLTTTQPLTTNCMNKGQNFSEHYNKFTKQHKFQGVDPRINFGENSNVTNSTNDSAKVDVIVESQPLVQPQQYLQHQPYVPQVHHNVITDGDYDLATQSENRQPPIGTGVPRTLDAPAKFIRAPDGRIIIRSPMAARSTTPPLNPITMIRQDLEMGVAPPVPVPPFWTRNDWWLPGADNVFAPKDIDLEDNTLDAAERELEAFKRFCQEPVPPQRQEVTHLNVNKIIIKKNNQQRS